MSNYPVIGLYYTSLAIYSKPSNHLKTIPSSKIQVQHSIVTILVNCQQSDFTLVCSFATSMVPIVFFLAFDAWKLPRFAYKTNAMYVIMALPIIYKECYDSSGYGKPKAFAATFVGQLAFGIFSMTRLGAFKKDTVMMSASPKVVGKIA